MKKQNHNMLIFICKRHKKRPTPLRLDLRKKLAPEVGLEPTTQRLTVACSTN